MPLRPLRVLIVTLLTLGLQAVPRAQAVPDLSGAWIWKSRPIERPLRIEQTSEELVVEAVGLPQGAVAEKFWLSGAERDETYPGPGFVRRYRTTGTWQGRTWVGIVKAYAGWAEGTMASEPHTVVTRWFTLDPSGTRLTVTSRGAGSRPGQGPGDYVYEFEKAP